MTTGDGRTITYTAFDKPTRITKGATTVDFFYGPDRKRFKRVDNTVENGTVTTVYAAGKAYEWIRDASGTKMKHYIGDFAVITKTAAGSGETVNYLHRDHLGSVDTITDHTGAVIQRMSFDTWGKRREINWQAMTEGAITAFNTDTTTRGFTGHEMIDSVGLIHMNGRVYDPTLGRFLSADPNVQALDNLQNFNRYSYVLNNPLSYTDPTGFFFAKLFKAIGRAFGKLFKAIGRAFKKLLRSPIFRAIIQTVACTFGGGAAGCAAAAGIMTAASGGSIRDALIAVAFSFVGSAASSLVDSANAVVQMIVKGAVSGAQAAARGGNFLVGFASGAIGAIGGAIAKAASSGFVRTLVSAVAGCASAVVSGGKCANGAATAAFANMLGELKNSRIARDGLGEEPKDPTTDVEVYKRLGLSVEVDPKTGMKTLTGKIGILCKASIGFCNKVMNEFGKWNVEVNGYKINISVVYSFVRSDIDIIIRAGKFSVTSLEKNEPHTIIVRSDFLEDGSNIALTSSGHEFGHGLGLGHRPNSTNSIMSYSDNRYIRAQDVRRLVDAYAGK